MTKLYDSHIVNPLEMFPKLCSDMGKWFIKWRKHDTKLKIRIPILKKCECVYKNKYRKQTGYISNVNSSFFYMIQL